MVKVESFIITVNDFQNEYYPGQVIEGCIQIKLNQEIFVKSLRVKLYGRAQTKLKTNTGHRTTIHKDEEIFINDIITLIGKEDSCRNLMAGTHNFHFEFVLPVEDLPSSYEDRNGHYIRYFIESRLRRPWKVDEVVERDFQVKEVIDCNSREFNIPSNLFRKEWRIPSLFNKSKPVVLWARTDRTAYCPGERIEIVELSVENGSNRTLSKVKVEFMQKITYKARENKISKSRNLAQKISTAPIKPEEVFRWSNQSMPVPLVPPTLQNCSLIIIKYYFKITVVIPYFFNKYIIIPLTIGTVPLHCSGALPPPYEDALHADTLNEEPPVYHDCVADCPAVLDIEINDIINGNDDILPYYTSLYPTVV